jgi:gluconate kinase
MLLILFGLLGSGKNYVGEILRDNYSMFFYDADTDLTPEMREAIQQERLVPDAVRDAFFAKVVEHLRRLRTREERLVCAQAMYREKHRQLIRAVFPDAQFILVQSRPDLIASRLRHRQSGVVSLEYARKIEPHFEPATLRHFVLDNTGDRAAIRLQLDRILNAIASSALKGH